MRIYRVYSEGFTLRSMKARGSEGKRNKKNDERRNEKKLYTK